MLIYACSRTKSRRSRKCFRYSFDRCDIGAMYERGNAYMNGDESQDLEQDDWVAESWYRRAAARGHAKAAERLGELLQKKEQ